MCSRIVIEKNVLVDSYILGNEIEFGLEHFIDLLRGVWNVGEILDKSLHFVHL